MEAWQESGVFVSFNTFINIKMEFSSSSSMCLIDSWVSGMQVSSFFWIDGFYHVMKKSGNSHSYMGEQHHFSLMYIGYILFCFVLFLKERDSEGDL